MRLQERQPPRCSSTDRATLSGPLEHHAGYFVLRTPRLDLESSLASPLCVCSPRPRLNWPRRPGLLFFPHLSLVPVSGSLSVRHPACLSPSCSRALLCLCRWATKLARPALGSSFMSRCLAFCCPRNRISGSWPSCSSLSHLTLTFISTTIHEPLDPLTHGESLRDNYCLHRSTGRCAGSSVCLLIGTCGLH